MERPTTCKAERKDGSPCQSQILLPSGLCHLHDPDRQASVLTARRQGGRNKSRVARVEKLIPASLRPVLTTLLEVLDETRRGAMDPKVASALASVAGAIVKVYSS